jgi:hypothetical protein
VDIAIKRHDTKGKFTDVLKLDGSPVDLTDASVKFLMKKTGLAISQVATIVSPTAGSVEYQPTADDVAAKGDFNQEWEVTFVDGSILTFPNDGYNTVKIWDDLG